LANSTADACGPVGDAVPLGLAEDVAAGGVVVGEGSVTAGEEVGDGVGRPVCGAQAATKRTSTTSVARRLTIRAYEEQDGRA
jgi:hypothetical protein